MSFLGILDFQSKDNVDIKSYLHLRVIRDDGINVVPDMSITITKLNRKEDNSRYNHFFSNGSGGITFKATVLIKESDMWGSKSVVSVLDEWYNNMTPLAVVTDAVDVPNGEYIISKNNNRKQTFKGSTIWDLEFTTYTPLPLLKFKNNNARVKQALRKNKKNAKKSNAKKAVANSKLKDCNINTLVYSKTKKTVKCVKYLQKILTKQKCYSGAIDGWYGKDTMKAVKRFQVNYNKKNVKSKTINGAVKNGAIVNSNTKTKGSTVVKLSGVNKVLPEDGKVDKSTFKALCKV